MRDEAAEGHGLESPCYGGSPGMREADTSVCPGVARHAGEQRTDKSVCLTREAQGAGCCEAAKRTPNDERGAGR